ncbi:inositol polyphosphate multikinase [Anthonomus grandis grandis]|uniref:inositol polyphosphate multikinase n=1 Tax=Anthonomus grandis grandis TaxID=2921223 RepID=UPI002165BD8E|nr:inositol polyphosphate multikinase [Anthonomus grandis grandis]XP_050310975.1 inositol polyphosphate multikinase [Anthonomus grandis grandis]XP_050310976.1 inositol polyphosphate multikinase [Anthonomus grandis grandis]
MGKYEMQSMPVQKAANNFICAHSTCKSLFFNGNADMRDNTNVNGIKPELFGLNQLLEEGDEGEGIPRGMEVLTNQVAGHIIDDSGGIGMLKKEGLAFKPLLKKEYAEREVKLYEQLETTVDRCLIEMRQLVPKYHGVQKLEVKGNRMDFLVLEDLTHGFKEPCIMDIKIGRRTWDPKATYDKIISEDQKYHECKRDLAFCIPGFQVYKIACGGQLVKYDKEYGKSLNKDGAKEAVKTFLNADTHHFCRKLLVQFLASLWQIQHFARNQRRLRLYATSILLVYDARRLKEHVNHKNPQGTNRPPLVRHRSLYRPLSLAQLNNGCERVPTGFSGQLTTDGPILRAPSKKSALALDPEQPRTVVNNNNTWQKSIHALKRTHSFQNNYDKDVQHRKQNYTSMLDDLCCESKSEVWATAKLIDFAHVYPSDSVDVDKNYLEGVENLVKMFEDFLAETDE